MDEDILEKLSELEHVQWCRWSEAISKEISLLLDILDKFEGDLSEEDLLTVSRIRNKLDNWNDLRVDYSLLPDDEKEKDRDYARMALTVFDEKI